MHTSARNRSVCVLVCVGVWLIGCTVGLHPLLVYNSLQPHPKDCQPGQIWLSIQSWWSVTQQTNHTATLDQGHLHMEHCANWMKPVTGAGLTITIDTLMHNHAGTQGHFAGRIIAGRSTLNDVGTKAVQSCMGMLVCRRPLWRTTANCTATNGALLAYGPGLSPRVVYPRETVSASSAAATVGASTETAQQTGCLSDAKDVTRGATGAVIDFALMPGVTDGLVTDCAWQDTYMLSINTSVQGQPPMMARMEYDTSSFVFSELTARPANEKGPGQVPRRFTLQSLLPVVYQMPGGPPPDDRFFQSVAAKDPLFNTLQMLSWTQDTTYEIGTIGPVFTMPVGGAFRTYIDMTGPTTKNHSHFVTLNANFHINKLGTVLAQGPGAPAGLLYIDLQAQALTKGWQRLAVVNSGVDPVTRAVHSGVTVLTFETIGRIPHTYNGRFMTFPVTIASAPTGSLGSQVQLHPATLQITSEVLSGITSSPLSNWKALLRFDLSFLEEIPNLTAAELILPIATVVPASGTVIEVHAVGGPYSWYRLPWPRAQLIPLDLDWLVSCANELGNNTLQSWMVELVLSVPPVYTSMGKPDKVVVNVWNDRRGVPFLMFTHTPTNI